MSIEQLFLKKAIEDKNYVRFTYEQKVYKRVKAFCINKDIVHCDMGTFHIQNLQKLTVLKEKFD